MSKLRAFLLIGLISLTGVLAGCAGCGHVNIRCTSLSSAITERLRSDADPVIRSTGIKPA